MIDILKLRQMKKSGDVKVATQTDDDEVAINAAQAEKLAENALAEKESDETANPIETEPDADDAESVVSNDSVISEDEKNISEQIEMDVLVDETTVEADEQTESAPETTEGEATPDSAAAEKPSIQDILRQKREEKQMAADADSDGSDVDSSNVNEEANNSKKSISDIYLDKLEAKATEDDEGEVSREAATLDIQIDIDTPKRPIRDIVLDKLEKQASQKYDGDDIIVEEEPELDNVPEEIPEPAPAFVPASAVPEPEPAFSPESEFDESPTPENPVVDEAKTGGFQVTKEDVEMHIAESDGPLVAGEDGDLEFFGDETDEMIHLVLFKLQGETFGVDIKNVQEIVRVAEITRVPHVTDHIIGVVNLRGNITPVIDLRKRFFGVDMDITKNTRIIMAGTSSGVVGFRVDESNEVQLINENDVEPPSKDSTSGVSDFITGIAKFEGKRLITIIDFNSIVSGNNL